MEIERKFLMSGYPIEGDKLTSISSQMVIQSYLSVNPEVRIRNNGKKHILCIKGEPIDDGLSRSEIELEITVNQYLELKSRINKESIVKYTNVYEMLIGDKKHILEVSRVDPRRDSTFMYAEIEFDSIEEAKNFVIPEWLRPFVIKEVTQDKEYKMKNYWKNTRGV